MATYFKPPYPARATYQVAALPQGRADRDRGHAGAADRPADARRRARDAATREDVIRRGEARRAARRASRRRHARRLSSRRSAAAQPAPETEAKAARAAGSPISCQARHRARPGSRPASAAALRGSHARRCRCTTLASGVDGAGRRHGRQHRHPVPAAPAARGADRGRCATTRGARAQLVLRFFHFYPEHAEGARARQARARLRRSARRPFRPRDRASAVQGDRAGRAAARPPDAGLSDDRGTRRRKRCARSTARALAARSRAAPPRRCPTG